MPIEFFHIHTADFSVWDGSRSSGEFRDLKTCIRKITDQPEEPHTSRELKPSPARPKFALRLGGRGWLVTIILLAAAALGVAIFLVTRLNEMDNDKVQADTAPIPHPIGGAGATKTMDPATQWVTDNKDFVVLYFRDPRGNGKICSRIPVDLVTENSTIAELEKLCRAYAAFLTTVSRSRSDLKNLRVKLKNLAANYPAEILGRTITTPSWISENLYNVNVDLVCVKNFDRRFGEARERSEDPGEALKSLYAARNALKDCPGVTWRAGIERDFNQLLWTIAITKDKMERERRMRSGHSVEPNAEDK